MSKDVILPYSVQTIYKGAYKKKNKTAVLYIYVLEENYISVNGVLYTNIPNDRKWNLQQKNQIII